MLAAIASLTLGIAGAIHWWRQRSALSRCLVELEAARSDFSGMERLARLAAVDLRDAALRLRGHSGALKGETERQSASALASLADRCQLLAHDLVSAGPARSPQLCPQPTDLVAYARETMAVIAATIAPGRRQFRFQAVDGSGLLWADRRALREVMLRVLGEAVLNTGEGDCIALSVEAVGDHGAVIVIADEGAGLAMVEGSSRLPDDSRGLGARLALARSLMQAHGGRLDLLAAPGAGTRVSLVFPDRAAFDGREP